MHVYIAKYTKCTPLDNVALSLPHLRYLIHEATNSRDLIHDVIDLVGIKLLHGKQIQLLHILI